MSAITYNFPIEKGSSFEIEFNYLDSNNNTIDLTNWCVKMQIVGNDNSFYSFSNKEYNNAYRLTTFNNGKILLQLSANFTNLINFSTAVYDLDIQEPHEQYSGSGYKIYRIVTGSISVIQRNTQTSSSINSCDMLSVDPDCSALCIDSDMFSKQYTGSGLIINDIANNQSLPINIAETDMIQNLSVSIYGLSHPSPQDLIFILSPPSGDAVLLSANQKINNYNNNFNFTISDNMNISSTLNNVTNNGICKIVDKTSYINYSSTLNSNFSHLLSTSPSGNWFLNILDTDAGGHGSISSWKINILYEDQEL